MDDQDRHYLFGAVTLLKECHETLERLFARFDPSDDVRAKRRIVAAAVYELKIHATIEELLLHPAPEPFESDAERRCIQDLIEKLESMTGEESRHDSLFEELSEYVRRHIRAEEKVFFEPPARRRISPVLALAPFLFAAALASAQSNQGGGEQLNPNTSLNSIISGGPTGQPTPVNLVTVPVTPASVPAPASNEKDRPARLPLPVNKPPRKKPLSDRALARKIHGEIVHDLTLPPGSQNIKVAAAAGKITLTGTALSAEDKYKIAAKAALLVGDENVVNLIDVKPPAPPPD